MVLPHAVASKQYVSVSPLHRQFHSIRRKIGFW